MGVPTRAVCDASSLIRLHSARDPALAFCGHEPAPTTLTRPVRGSFAAPGPLGSRAVRRRIRVARARAAMALVVLRILTRLSGVIRGRMVAQSSCYSLCPLFLRFGNTQQRDSSSGSGLRQSAEANTAAPTVMSLGMSRRAAAALISFTSSRMACRIPECTVHSDVLCHYCKVGKVQISSTPTVACSLALPSGSAILPSTTIGLFQWPLPHSKLAICVPLRGS